MGGGEGGKKGENAFEDCSGLPNCRMPSGGGTAAEAPGDEEEAGVGRGKETAGLGWRDVSAGRTGADVGGGGGGGPPPHGLGFSRGFPLMAI